MKPLVKIREVHPLEGHWVRLRFSDDVVMDVDLSEVVAGGGVFEPIHDDLELFRAVRVNPENGTIGWPGEVDLDAQVLYGSFEPASGVRIRRERVTPPAS